MINLNTLYDDMHGKLKWDDKDLYSKHYQLPDSTVEHGDVLVAGGDSTKGQEKKANGRRNDVICIT